jgi:hypothetical protein
MNELNDPRVSGEMTGTFEFDGWGSGMSQAFVQWGAVRLQNDGGAWVGKYSGAFAQDQGDLAGEDLVDLAVAQRPHATPAKLGGDPPAVPVGQQTDG